MKKSEKCDGKITIETDLEFREKVIECAERLNMSLEEFVSLVIKEKVEKIKSSKKSKYYSLEEIRPEDETIERNFADARAYAINKMQQEGVRVFAK